MHTAYTTATTPLLQRPTGPASRLAGAVPTLLVTLQGTRNGALPASPADGSSRSILPAQPAHDQILRAVDWAPRGTDTPEKLKSSFRVHLDTLSSDIDSARGHRFKLEDAYAHFARRTAILLDACTAGRISTEDADHIATVVLRKLADAPQPPPYQVSSGMDTRAQARQAAAHYATK